MNTAEEIQAAPKRCQNWPRELARYLAERRKTPFAWGSHDCVRFTCDWVVVLTGIDPAARFRDQYTNKATALELLCRERGLDFLAQKEFARCGFDEIPVKLARRGDVVMLDRAPYGHTLGICEGARSWFAGMEGVESLPTRDCVHAWRVGQCLR